MITDLKPYAEYKDSGSKWLGNVPVTWEVRNLRTLISRRTERNRPELPLLSVAREKGVFVRSLTDADENHNVIPEDLSNYKVARAGNLVINKMKAWQGSMGIAPCDGIVSPAYFVFDFRIANHAYGQRLLRSKPYVAHFGQASDGVRVGQWDLSVPGMRQIPVLLPPPDEQAAIVHFLDWANGRLERAIRAKRKVIALLNEQKQAIIHRAVTRGLDPSVPLKDSGVPWLGEIPEHWEVGKIKRFFCTCSGATPSSGRISLYYDGPIPWIRTMDLNNGIVDAHVVGITQRAIEDTACKVLPAGSVLVALYGGAGTIGKNGLLAIEAATNQALCALLPSRRFEPKFVLFFMQYQRRYWMVGADGTRKDPNISQDRIRDCLIVLPSLSEQHKIVSHVENETNGLQLTISRLEREITLLREYRTRLVADVVTGTLDVREAAAALPDEEPIAEVTNLPDLDDEFIDNEDSNDSEMQE